MFHSNEYLLQLVFTFYYFRLIPQGLLDLSFLLLFHVVVFQMALPSSFSRHKTAKSVTPWPLVKKCWATGQLCFVCNMDTLSRWRWYSVFSVSPTYMQGWRNLTNVYLSTDKWFLRKHLSVPMHYLSVLLQIQMQVFKKMV